MELHLSYGHHRPWLNGLEHHEVVSGHSLESDILGTGEVGLEVDHLEVLHIQGKQISELLVD